MKEKKRPRPREIEAGRECLYASNTIYVCGGGGNATISNHLSLILRESAHTHNAVRKPFRKFTKQQHAFYSMLSFWSIEKVDSQHKNGHEIRPNKSRAHTQRVKKNPRSKERVYEHDLI